MTSALEIANQILELRDKGEWETLDMVSGKIILSEAVLTLHEDLNTCQVRQAHNATCILELHRKLDKLQADLKEALDVIRFYASRNWRSDGVYPDSQRAREFLVKHEGKEG